ncbi:unnamed protein product, partial [Allacma fusca]
IFCTQDGPAAWANPHQYTEDQHNDCFENVTSILKPYFGLDLDSRKRMLDLSFFLCWLSSVAGIKLEDLYTPNLDFTKYFNLLAPRFLSNASRGRVITTFVQTMAKIGLKMDPANPF